MGGLHLDFFIKHSLCFIIKNSTFKWFGFLENLLTENKSSEWFVGDKMSVADLAIWRLLGWIISGKLEHVPTTLLGTFPYLTKLYANVNSHPKVQEWMSLKYRN